MSSLLRDQQLVSDAHCFIQTTLAQTSSASTVETTSTSSNNSPDHKPHNDGKTPVAIAESNGKHFNLADAAPSLESTVTPVIDYTQTSSAKASLWSVSQPLDRISSLLSPYRSIPVDPPQQHNNVGSRSFPFLRQRRITSGDRPSKQHADKSLGDATPLLHLEPRSIASTPTSSDSPLSPSNAASASFSPFFTRSSPPTLDNLSSRFELPHPITLVPATTLMSTTSEITQAELQKLPHLAAQHPAASDSLPTLLPSFYRLIRSGPAAVYRRIENSVLPAATTLVSSPCRLLSQAQAAVPNVDMGTEAFQSLQDSVRGLALEIERLTRSNSPRKTVSPRSQSVASLDCSGFGLYRTRQFGEAYSPMRSTLTTDDLSPSILQSSKAATESESMNDETSSNLMSMLPFMTPLWPRFSQAASDEDSIHYINTLLSNDRSCLVVCVANMLFFLIGVCMLFLLAATGVGNANYSMTYHSGFWNATHSWICFSAMFALFLVFSMPSTKKQRIAAVALTILLVCVITYLILALRLLPVYDDIFGHELHLIRYCEWMATTPLMLLLVCNLEVQPVRVVVWIMVMDVGMIVFGAFASFASSYSWMIVFLLASFACEIDTLYNIHLLFNCFRLQVEHFPRIAHTVFFLEVWLIAAYIYFPFIWLAAAAGLFPSETVQSLYYVGDTTGKLLFTASLLIINFEILDHQVVLQRIQHETNHKLQLFEEKSKSEALSKQQAQMSNERKREFLRYCMHELRVPLNALVLGLESLRHNFKMDHSEALSMPAAAHEAQASPKPAPSLQQITAAPQSQRMLAVISPTILLRKLTNASDINNSIASAVAWGDRHYAPLTYSLDYPRLQEERSSMPSTVAQSAWSHAPTAPSSSSTSSSSVSQASLQQDSISAVRNQELLDNMETVNLMSSAAAHMIKLVDDVLSLQKIEDGELVLDVQPFSMQRACACALKLLQHWTKEKHIEVEHDVDSQLPILLGDQGRVMQILINYFANAIRFTHEGGRLKLTVKECEPFESREPVIANDWRSPSVDETTEISERARVQAELHPVLPIPDIPSAIAPLVGNITQHPSPPTTALHQERASSLSSSASTPVAPVIFVRVSVRDTGIGMNSADLTRIFEPFVSIEAGSQKEKGKQSGLGLAIVRKLVDLFEGRVGVISVLGQGSEFYFEAPFEMQLPPVQVAVHDSISCALPSASSCIPELSVKAPAPSVAPGSPQLIPSMQLQSNLPLKSVLPVRSLLMEKAQLNSPVPHRSLHRKSQSLEPSSFHTSPPHIFVPNRLPATVVDIAGVLGSTMPSQTSRLPTNPFISDVISNPALNASLTQTPAHVPFEILVVDDAESNRKLLARLVSRNQFANCQQAKHGKEAVDLISLNHSAFHAVLMDSEMPIMSGGEAVKTLRSMGVTTPIIGVTANCLLSDQLEFKSCGLDGLLIKPVNLSLLTATITNAIAIATNAGYVQRSSPVITAESQTVIAAASMPPSKTTLLSAELA